LATLLEYSQNRLSDSVACSPHDRTEYQYRRLNGNLTRSSLVNTP